MTAGSLLPVRLWKEMRGLSPAWLACVATVVLAAGFGGRMLAVGWAGYVIGAAALGALSVGHEYNCRTLALLLAQPARRERLFLEKMGVLALMLVGLGGVAWLGLFDPDVQSGLGVRWTRTLWALAFGLPLLCGLFVAPWLTMACRNPLAGTVFALAIPAAVWLASDVTSAMTYGGELAATVEARELALGIFWRGMLTVCALAAVASWWMFIRLEAIESRGLELSLPAWVPGLSGRAGPMSATPAFTRQRATWVLVKKELHLQQLTFAVSGLYVAGWAGLLSFGQLAPASRTTLLFMLTVFHSGTVPLLAGSLASAEERHLGTLEWQTLLPMAGWKQWVTKAAVALGIALTLTLGLPALLLYMSAIPGTGAGEVRPPTSIGWAVILIVVTGLYVSSVCANGLRAFLIAVPAVFAVVGFTAPYVPWFRLSTWWERWSWMYRQPETIGAVGILYMASLDLLAIVMYAGALGLLLKYAMTNHHSAEHGTGRVWKQLMGLAAFLAIGLGLWGGASRLYGTRLHERIQARQITVTGMAVDNGNSQVKDYTVMIFPADPDQRDRRSTVVRALANSQGEFRIVWLRPGRYSFAAVENNVESAARRDPALLDRLKAVALPVTLAPGDSKALTLTLSQF